MPQTEKSTREERLGADLRDTQLLREFAVRLVTEENQQVFYDEIMTAAIALTNADAATVQILDDRTQELVMSASQGIGQAMALHFDRVNARSNSSCGKALATGKRTFIQFDDPTASDPDGALRIYVENGLLSGQSTPLVTRSGKPVGMLSTHWRDKHEPNERELSFIDLLARQAADLIELRQTHDALRASEDKYRQSEEQLRYLNELLEERVRERTSELASANVALKSEVADRRAAEERIKNLLRQLVNSEEQQRRRIARELHDTLGQQLAALHIGLELLKSKATNDETVLADIGRMREIFDQLNSNIDFLAWELRPASLDLLGLDEAFKTYVQDWSEQFGIEANYHSAGMESVRLSSDVETHLYRIFQEVLQNVHKHSNAYRVNVLFERREGQAVLIVEDNGAGYDADQQISDDRGMGFTNMKERAALVNGHIEIESQPGVGTTVFARVPVSEAA